MTTLIRSWKTTAGALALLLALVGCENAPESLTPGLEEALTAILTTETETVASQVRSARSHLPADPAAAEADLALAEGGLARLLTYYLPLLEAREQAYNAFRNYHQGLTKRTQAELDDIEALLIKVGEGGDGLLLREMKEPLEHLEDARAALGSDTGDAAGALQALATRLDFLLLRGGLVLGR